MTSLNLWWPASAALLLPCERTGLLYNSPIPRAPTCLPTKLKDLVAKSTGGEGLDSAPAQLSEQWVEARMKGGWMAE
jgi:hypothetical protein